VASDFRIANNFTEQKKVLPAILLPHALVVVRCPGWVLPKPLVVNRKSPWNSVLVR